MFEGKNFRVVLLSGGFTQWSSAITPLLLAQTDCLSVVESVEELCPTSLDTYPEMIAVCHCPGVFDGIAAAHRIREFFPVVPLVLLAIENIDTLKTALEIGAISILEPPFEKSAVETAFNRCRRQAWAIQGEAVRLRAMDSAFAVEEPENTASTWLESTPCSSGHDSEIPGQQPFTVQSIPTTVSTATLSTPPADNTVSLASLKILVAEDLPMLQIIIKNLLENIGCQYVLVGNGQAVLDEWEQGGFDVILMDLRMPVLDGFAATRQIRMREQATGNRIPIVALSSYSLQDIMDKCLEIGMDSYLIKPVERKKLEETLRWLIMPHDVTKQSETILSSLDELPVLDAHATLVNLGSDLDFYRELIQIYLETCAGLGDELADILGDSDLKNIRSTAHSLKGIVSNIGGQRLAEVARQIQEMCHEGNKPAVSVWTPLVRAESAALKSAMEAIQWDELRQLLSSDTAENR